jgi:hypothetical protein
MSLEIQVRDLAIAIGDDIQTILGNIGTLASLNTTDKSNLVNAINEVLAQVGAGGGGGGGDLLASNNLSELTNIATARTNLDVRSTAQVTAEIASAVSAITLVGLGGLTQAEVDARVQLVVDSAPSALDTLNELASALNDDPNFANTITNALANKVGFDAPQALTGPQQLQACQNIGVGDPERNFVADYTTARDT